MKRILATLVLVMAILLTANACKKKDYDSFGNIAGTVIDKDTGKPVANANINIMPSYSNTHTGSDGTFEVLNLEAGRYTLTVDKTGYNPEYVYPVVKAGETTNANIVLVKSGE